MEAISNNNSINLEKVCKNGCGLSQDEYKILLEDIEQAIEEGNRKYGYGGHGYLEKDRNYYPFHDNDKPKRFIEKTTNSKLAFDAAKNKARAVKKPKLKRQELKDRDLFLSWIHKKLEAAGPTAKEKFAASVEGASYGYHPGKLSVEELAIMRGIIKVHYPPSTEKGADQ